MSEKQDKCEHDRYEVVGTCGDGCCDRLHCLDCDKYWNEEVAD